MVSTEDEEPLVLNYDTVRQARPMVTLHYVALACALVPLSVGIVVFLGFMVTREHTFAFLGLLTLFGGACFAIIGWICTWVYGVYQARRADPADHKLAVRRAKWSALIIAANFPIAFVLTLAGVWAMSLMTVIVSNDGTTAIDAVILSTDGGDLHFGKIQPNGSASLDTFRSRILVTSCAVVRNGTREDHPNTPPVVATGDVTNVSLYVDVTDGSVAIYSNENW